MDAYQYVINNLTSQTFLELMRFQKSWSLTGRDQNWTCLEPSKLDMTGIKQKDQLTIAVGNLNCSMSKMSN